MSKYTAYGKDFINELAKIKKISEFLDGLQSPFLRNCFDSIVSNPNLIADILYTAIYSSLESYFKKIKDAIILDHEQNGNQQYISTQYKLLYGEKEDKEKRSDIVSKLQKLFPSSRNYRTKHRVYSSIQVGYSERNGIIHRGVRGTKTYTDVIKKTDEIVLFVKDCDIKIKRSFTFL
ncbi:MAG: hypothetical protein ACFN4U_02680 [Candidatus Absconditicoccaceae bacterium]